MPDDIHAIFEYTGTYSHRLAYSLSLREILSVLLLLLKVKALQHR
jgi:hypothetical protein